jgi:hypothetical protein
MLEILFGIMPLIFVCSAVGILLINFPTVSAYIVYVLSMMVKPHDLIQEAKEQSAPIEKPHEQKNKLMIPFIRMATLFRVLFFPNIDIDSTARVERSFAESAIRNVYSEKAQEEINKYPIKTYSADALKDNNKFRYSYDPVDTVPLSNEFQKAFPDIVTKLQTQQDIVNLQNPTVVPLNNKELKINL